ncbi:hypothetical protein C0Q70_14072 [Pomacea canaliculata]|uniref:Uncharacterized protein n=1 Tax=Pomacea canaliculata TaxID=400727 RepID=A0A2T7NYZ4_POMCA|nr:hypothetical protein C0Q70_14072 [Pomacea canaliculata]
MDLRALSSGGGRQAAAKLIGSQIQAGGQRRLAKGKTTPCDSLDRGGRRQIGQVELTLRRGRQKGLNIVTGGEDGNVRIYEIDGCSPSSEPQVLIETKGGPIQCLAVHNVTRFGQKDVTAVDSQGTLTVLCGQQILSRQSLAAHALTCLQVQEDGRGYIEIVTSTEGGLITACQASSQLWSFNLNDIIKMVQGNFFPSSQLGSAGGGVGGGVDSRQVALGCSSGSIYIFYNMSVTAEEVARAESPITQLAALTLPDSPLDLLLCSGHFAALNVYRHGELAYKHETNDWVNSIVTADVDSDGVNEVVIGCQDNTISALKFL